MSACLEEPDCIITSTNLVKINFKKDAKTSREILFTKINVSGLADDFYVGKTVSSVQLPVDPTTDQTTFTFVFEGRTETLTLAYNKRAELISPTCGIFLNYSDLSISETTFTETIIANHRLIINAASNVEIYLQ